jgi:hypothetical protein
MQRDRMTGSPGDAATEFMKVLAGQALIRCLADRADRYGGKVQQPVRTCPDWWARSGTATFEDRRWWTACLLKPHAKTDSEALTRKNVLLSAPLTLALILACGAS